MKFTVFAGAKKLDIITAKDLKLAEELCNKKYPNWTEIYIGERDVNW